MSTLIATILPLISGYREPPDPCQSNLVLVGTVASTQGYYIVPPATKPHLPEGRVGTAVTFTVEREVLDSQQAISTGTVTMSFWGGTVGTTVQIVPEMPTTTIGSRLALFANVLPGRTYPLVLDWRQLDPAAALPSTSTLVTEWGVHCDSN